MNEKMTKKRAGEVWKLLRAEASPLSLEAADCISWAMNRPVSKRGTVKGEIKPLHREIILIFQGRIQIESRDASEWLAWGKIEDFITADMVASIRSLYKDSEFTQKQGRKTNPTILMNNLVTQHEIAEKRRAKLKAQQEREDSHLLPEPEDWKSRVVGKLPEYTWEFICKNYPDEAKLLQGAGWKWGD